VTKKSTVGAGDSMVAGITHMLQKGRPLNEVIRFGVACGTAATMNEGTQLFNRNDAELLFQKMQS
jgi:6-phosphofructokinase 2